MENVDKKTEVINRKFYLFKNIKALDKSNFYEYLAVMID